MTSSRFGPTFRSVFIVSPLVRVWESGLWGKVYASLVACLAFATTDIYFTLLPALVGANILDWWEGRRVARKRDVYHPFLNTVGWQSKLGGIGYTALVRYMEGWTASHGPGSTYGYVAAVLTLMLIAADLESVSRKRAARGAPPLPLMGPLLRWIRSIPIPKPAAAEVILPPVEAPAEPPAGG